jgi:glucose-6-phosphate-specific signal transduction histidine kinase
MGIITSTVPSRVPLRGGPPAARAASKVTKHAQATLVDIRLRVGVEVSLAVIDNGVGPGEPLAKGGHGLQNLHQRAKSLGGDFTTQPAQRRGPVATWSVPRQMPARIQS